MIGDFVSVSGMAVNSGKLTQKDELIVLFLCHSTNITINKTK